MSKKKRRKYTKEFKEEAVRLIAEEGYSYAEAGRNLGVTPNLLSLWKREFWSNECPSCLQELANYSGNTTVGNLLSKRLDKGTNIEAAM